jgi:hypothetical protein
MPLSGEAEPSAPRRRGPPRETGPSIEEAIVDAEKRPLDFPAKERAAYVSAMVNRVQELKTAGRTPKEIEGQLPEFKRDHPYLFEMVVENDDYDRASLNTMLAMLERMGDGSLNHHQATVIVGKRLASKYIQSGEK